MSGIEAPVPTPWAGTRGARVEKLLADLLDDVTRTFPLRRRTVDDPTVALLDAWATMADVIAFYSERIRMEGYLGSALQPESVLAVAGLTGTRPRAGLAASVHLAYTLYPDPADTSVVLPAGLLSQTVPGPGEQVQTFETTAELVARPSWNELTLLPGRPKTTLATDSGPTTTLQVDGAATRLTTNSFLLWRQDEAPPRLLRTRSVAADPTLGITTVVVAPVSPDAPDPGPDDNDTPTEESPADAETTTPSPAVAALLSIKPGPSPITSTLNDLKSKLDLQPPAQPARVDRTTRQIFSTSSDTTPRLMAALQPGLAGTLYSALATSMTSGVETARVSALRLSAAPFGAQAPPRTVFDDRGRPVPSPDWPIGGALTLTAQLPAAVVRRAGDNNGSDNNGSDNDGDEDGGDNGGDNNGGGGGELSFSATQGRPPFGVLVSASADGFPSQQATLPTGSDPVVELGALGRLTTSQQDGSTVISYAPPAELSTTAFDLAVAVNGDAGTIGFTIDGTTSVWSAADRSTFRSQFGEREMLISWDLEHTELTWSLTTPLPYAEDTVLHLDATYPDIAVDSTVVITKAGPADGSGPSYPVITTVKQADTVTKVAYGLSSRVTRLVLAEPWIGPATSLAAVRDLEVHGRPEGLTLRPTPITEDLANEETPAGSPVPPAKLELAGLHAGLEAGRSILITGQRAGLPNSAAVRAGELAVISGVNLETDPGAAPHTVLTLTGPLTYRYTYDSVRIYGNVVRAHQSATVVEVLGSGDPSVDHQSFTLASAPELADPTAAGITPSLVVHVDGRRYDAVTRLDDDTPATAYLTGQDPTGHTTLTFAAPLPPGQDNVVAKYRVGFGDLGNVRPGQVSQLLSRPVSVSGVSNPLAGSGGANPEGPESLRQRVGIGVSSQGRAVSLSDYVDAALAWPGIGKATAVLGSDGLHQVVRLHVAGTGPAPLTQDSDLVAALDANLGGDGRGTPLEVAAVLPLTMILKLRMVRDPDWTWPSVVAGVRQALSTRLGYDRREIGEDVLLGPIIAAAQSVPGVIASSVTGLALVSAATTPEELADLSGLLARPVLERTAVSGGRAQAVAEVAFVNPDLPDSILCEELTP